MTQRFDIAGTVRGLAACLLAAGMIVGASGSSEAADRTLRLNQMFSATTSWGKSLQRFADLVKEKTGGKVEVKVYPDGQLGQERESEEALQMGNLDFFMGGPGVLTNFDPKIGIFDMPFLYKDYETANKIMDGAVGKAVFDSLRTNGKIRVLGSAAQGFRYVLVKNHPVNGMADVKGLKIRVPEADTFIQTFRLIGANPVAVPWLETYTAFQGGVVDGMEGTPEVMRTAKMYEVGKDLVITRHIMATLQLLMSEKTYQSLSPDLQKAVEAAGTEAWNAQRKLSEAENVQAEEDLKKAGVKVTTPDLKPFQDAVRPLWKTWSDKTGTAELIDAIQKM
jgi:tripartite ATP-independent transporter DctP family solute receptor